MRLMNVAHVPGLSHQLLSVRHIADAGNKCTGTREGIRLVFAKSGDELFAPSCGQLNGLFGYHTDRSSEENIHAVITPGARPTLSNATGMNGFHCSHGHMHDEDLLRKTAKQIGVKLQRQLVPCQGRSEAKGTRKPVKPFTYTRATKPANGVLLTYDIGAEVREVDGRKGVHDDSEKGVFAILQGMFPLHQRRDCHAFYKVPGRDSLPAR